jgi:hypothetical protein
MSAKSDVLYKNHFVSDSAKNKHIDGEERVMIQFSRLERTAKGKKYIRATLNASKKEFKEIVEKYGLQDALVGRWEVWDAEEKKNVPFQD